MRSILGGRSDGLLGGSTHVKKRGLARQRIDFCEILTSVENTIKLSCRVGMV